MLPRKTILGLGFILIVLLALPPFIGLSWQNALVNVLIASLFATAFNVLSGQAGLLSFGHAAYFGIGAFATLHLMGAVEDGLPFPTVMLPLAGAIAGLVIGLAAGYFATKRSGVYFALVTLAIAELFHSLAPQWKEIFGGEAGISAMRMPWMGFGFGSTLEIYYLALAWTVLSMAILWAYTRTPFGRLTLALRDNEQRVRFLGYHAHSAKVIIFSVSGMFSGIAGALQAVSNETANYALFAAGVSSQVVLHTFVGGATVFFGPAAGAALFTLFTYLVSDLTRSWVLYQGLIFVLVMLYAPAGIGGAVEYHLRHRQHLNWRALSWPYALAGLGAVLLASGIVFIIESASVLFGDSYAMARQNAVSVLPPFEAFGAVWSPLNPLTWLVPILLLAAGIFLIRRVKTQIAQVWERASEPTDLPAAMEGAS